MEAKKSVGVEPREMNKAGGGTGSSSQESAKRESKRPTYSRFTQQELPACKPILTPKWVIATFFMIGVIFIPIGGIALAASNSVVEVGKRYDDECFKGMEQQNPNLTSNPGRDAYIRDLVTNKTCEIVIKIPKTMKAPVFVYYQLDNFYQNHRRYVKSRSDVQLRTGDNSKIGTNCKPKDCIEINGTCEPIVPCGLIAWSFFNDTYSFFMDTEELVVNNKGIAWKSDVKDKYGDVMPQHFNDDPATRGGGTLSGPLDKNEHFMVWMRTAALPTFRKLWGKIDRKLTVNSEIRVRLENQYNTYSFGGKKKVILSTTSWLGGANNFLGVAYLTVGVLCMFSSFLFFLIHWRNPRPLGDTSYLSWNRRSDTSGVNAAN